MKLGNAAIRSKLQLPSSKAKSAVGPPTDTAMLFTGFYKSLRLLVSIVIYTSVRHAHGLDCDHTLSLSSMFRQYAVLQRSPATPLIHGTAPPDANLDILVAGQRVQSATADADGGWAARLPAQPAAWNVTLTVKGGNGACPVSAIVSFGETVMCSGQSNMGMPVVATTPCCHQPDPPKSCHCFQAQNGTAEIAAAGRYSGKIVVAQVSSLTLQQNGTYCPCECPALRYCS